jgi:signal transduction histidine kinase
MPTPFTGHMVGTHSFANAFTEETNVTKRGINVDISLMIRWIVVFLVIFILLMALVFSFIRPKINK